METTRQTAARIVALSALRDNYIWALIEGDNCCVVDPGEAAPVLRLLHAQGLRLSAILLTHRHADHQGGVAELLAQYPVPVFGPASTAMPLVNQVLSDQQIIRVPNLTTPLRVLAVPGHTEEHIAYLWQDALFCGDTLFAAGCGRLLGGSAAQLHASLQSLAALPAQTRVYCTHEYTLANLAFAMALEPENARILSRQASCQALRERGEATLPSSLAEELLTNPFLRCTEPALIHAAEKHTGHALHGPLAVFTALRQWKDDF